MDTKCPNWTTYDISDLSVFGLDIGAYSELAAQVAISSQEELILVVKVPR